MIDKRNRIKIATLSAEGCEPCKKLQDEIAELSGEFDIDLVVVDTVNLINDPDKLDHGSIPEAFGKVDVVPTTIIETGSRSKKLTGYTEGGLRKAIEEVLKPSEE